MGICYYALTLQPQFDDVMSRNRSNLATGIVIGAAAGFVAGILMSGGKNKKTEDIKSKISNLAADAQERIKALRDMAQNHDIKAKSEAAENNSGAGRPQTT